VGLVFQDSIMFNLTCGEYRFQHYTNEADFEKAIATAS